MQDDTANPNLEERQDSFSVPAPQQPPKPVQPQSK
mgnify:CR=1 FL=1